MCLSSSFITPQLGSEQILLMLTTGQVPSRRIRLHPTTGHRPAHFLENLLSNSALDKAATALDPNGELVSEQGEQLTGCVRLSPDWSIVGEYGSLW